MSRFSQFGNDLYSGKRSFRIVPRRGFWYTISAVLLAISATMLGIGAFGASAVSNIGRVDAGYVLPDGTFFQVPDCPAEPLVSFAKLLFPAVAWLGLVGTLVGFGSLLWPRAVVRR